ncbi:hypothetical protein [Nocardia colli]|uniref:hypothetical protein n=1 Tax=Nocardia colli TaxID=2545717 RepID=UPI0035DB1852
MPKVGRYGTMLRTRRNYTGESYRDLRDYAALDNTRPIPVATGKQSWLESEIFREVTELREWTAHPLGIARVRINPDNSLIVYLDSHIQTRRGTIYSCSSFAVDNLLPFIRPDGELSGIPGLRVAAVDGRDLVVSLVDSRCRVTVRGVAGTRWTDHITELETWLKAENLPRCWSSPTSTSHERDFQQEVPRTMSHRRDLAWLGSALLRRIALFETTSTAFCTKDWVTAGTWFFELSTRHDVQIDHDAFISKLTDPVWGLPMRVEDSYCMCSGSSAFDTTCNFDLIHTGSTPGELQLRFVHRRADHHDDLRSHLVKVGADEQWLDRVLPKLP